MFKKVALYGIAFGSMSASMLLIQYINGLYKVRNWISVIPMIANILLPAIGVFLFIKSISNMKTEKPINMGKALFGALLVCTITAICSIAAYQHIYTNRKDIMQDVRSRHYASIESQYSKDTTITIEKREQDIATAKENFEKNSTVGNFGRIQFLMCLSTGMVVALLTFLRNSKR